MVKTSNSSSSTPISANPNFGLRRHRTIPTAAQALSPPSPSSSTVIVDVDRDSPALSFLCNARRRRPGLAPALREMVIRRRCHCAVSPPAPLFAPLFRHHGFRLISPRYPYISAPLATNTAPQPSAPSTPRPPVQPTLLASAILRRRCSGPTPLPPLLASGSSLTKFQDLDGKRSLPKEFVWCLSCDSEETLLVRSMTRWSGRYTTIAVLTRVVDARGVRRKVGRLVCCGIEGRRRDEEMKWFDEIEKKIKVVEVEMVNREMKKMKKGIRVRYQRTSLLLPETKPTQRISASVSLGMQGEGTGGTGSSGKRKRGECIRVAAAEDVAAAEEGRRELSRPESGRREGARRSAARGEARRRGGLDDHVCAVAGAGSAGSAERRRRCTSRSSEEKEEVQ
ncbi:hypothetical protein Syun_016931 [Stephania yunnanensis]|uniref:Uncharacterized protein n=1 Tax=Stephania yunnanensis TaxID=152371 RepID=A0AAP0J644_9MAGN